MNVLYLCPICQSRLFAPASMPIYKCRIHTDTMMEQAEEFAGPNFEYKEVGEINPKKTGVRTFGAVDEAGNSTVTIVMDKPPELLSEEEELKQLREMYERVSEEKVDKRWGIPRLKREIEDLERDAALALERQEQEALLADAEDSNG